MKNKINIILLSIITATIIACEKDPIPSSDTPTVITGSSTVQGNTTAKVEFTISGYNYSNCGIVYSTNSNPSNGSQKTEGESTKIITGLKCNTTYYYRAYVSDYRNNYLYGNVKSFRTNNFEAKVTTGSACYKGYNSSYNYNYPYRFDVSATLIGLDRISTWGIMVSSSYDFAYYNSSKVTRDYIEGDLHTENWGSQSYGQTYYYRAYAILNNGTYIYGTTYSVKTSPY